MKLTFIRADHEVTGSCTLLEIGGHYGLIDCGMEQGRDLFENIAIPVPAAQIEFVLVTHAHMDHTGHLPLLYKQGFRGTVYATEATCDLCGIMLRDAAHIQMSEAEWKGRKAVGRDLHRAARAGQPAPEPLYTLEDVEGVLRLLRPCGYGKRIQVGENIIIRFTDVGHLLGSACIEAWLTEGGTEKKIVFSGDIGNTDQPIIRDPQTVSGADYVLIESTYGDRSHGPRVDYLTALADCIQRTLDRGGNVVIPSFAVGRTQELLYFIRQIKDAGMVLIHKCTTVKHALKAQSLGADMVVADGFECAGHPGENDLGTMVLTPRCVEALDIPVICAGGVSTGRQMAAALMLGAEGVYMGTRFLLSEECPVLPAVKNYLVEHANEMETILLLRSFQNSTRMYKSEVAKRVFAKEQAGCEFKDVAEDMAGKTACKMFFENADVENCGVICCGQTSGLIHDVLPVQTIIGQMMHECEATIAKFA